MVDQMASVFVDIDKKLVDQNGNFTFTINDYIVLHRVGEIWVDVEVSTLWLWTRELRSFPVENFFEN